MGAPSASVLFAKPVADADLIALFRPVAAAGESWESFCVVDTHPIGGSYRGARRCFDLEHGNSTDREPTDLTRIAAAWGRQVVDEVVAHALCNNPGDHRILAELCLALAERFDGLIDFHGALEPPLTNDFDLFEWERRRWEDTEPECVRILAGLAGWHAAIPYEVADGSTWAFHVGDARFLGAWMSHPQFRMVK